MTAAILMMGALLDVVAPRRGSDSRDLLLPGWYLDDA